MEKETVKPEKEKRAFNKKKLKYGTLATIITVVFIAVIVVLNLIAGVLTDRKGLKIDLTKEQYYDISQESIDYIKTIKTDVEIAVTAKESSLESQTGKMVLETLNKFKQYNDHITVDFYDVASNPDIITRYSQIYNGEIKEGQIVIEANDKVKVLDIVNGLFTIQSDYYGNSSITGYKGEQELLSAVMNVTDANPKKAAIISLYNGASICHTNNGNVITLLSTLMDKNGYEVSEIDLMSDALSPDDYDLIVLPAPINDLTQDSIKKMEDFLYNDGNLDRDMLYIADYIQYATPNLDDFLEVWGIEVGSGIVYDDTDYSQYVYTTRGELTAPIGQLADETYMDGLSNTKLPVVVPLSRPVNLLFDSNVDRTTKSILTTTDSAFLYPMEVQSAEEAQAMAEAAENGEEPTEAETEPATEFDPDKAEKSLYNLMAVATKSNTDSNNNVHENNLMVIGGASILDYYLVNSSTYNNAEYVVNAVNKMCGKENTVIIAQKDLSAQTIDIKSSQIKAISRVVIYVIPLIVVAAGIVVFLRRKNR
ncbi:MAG: Gldg family protein [Clostridium sp.]|nr:Gldg family protein [Clostridium sp.]MCM1547466.1 Gldg family protein [Ruminococcus sp.]